MKGRKKAPSLVFLFLSTDFWGIAELCEVNNSNNSNSSNTIAIIIMIMITIIHASYEQCFKCFMWTLDNWLWWVRKMKVLGNTIVLETRPGPNAKIWVGKAEGITDIYWHHLCAVRIAPLYSLFQLDKIRRKAVSLPRVKVATGLSACLNWPAFRTKYFR